MELSEQPDNNTYVLDPESPVELARLIDQDRIVTQAMGGPLVGVSHLPEEAKVLDLACGPGGWALDVAFARRDVEIAGVDISKIMVDYARARAHTQYLGNASFEVMNITQPLEFSDSTFDLVNARFCVGVVRREHWDAFLAECGRVLKPGGTLRLTEPVETTGTTNSESYERFVQLVHKALWRSGYGFSVNGYSLGITTVLPRILRKGSYNNVRYLPHALEFSTDCEAWQDMYQNLQASRYLAPRLLQKAEGMPLEEIDAISQQAITDMLSDQFCGVWHFATISGEKP